MLGKHARIRVCRAVGDIDRKYGFKYPLNFGYYVGSNPDGKKERIGSFILGITHPVREFDGRVIAILTKDSGEQLLIVAPKSKHLINHEIDEQVGFLKEYFDYKLDCFYERSCGAIAFKKVNSAVKFLLIKNKRSSNWSFPKGHIEVGETDEQTAIREVKEETGIDIDIIRGFKGKSVYQIQGKIEKTVYIFAARAKTTDITIQQEEIESYKWADYRSAMKSLKFDNDRSILWRANTFLRKSGAYSDKIKNDTN
jgi:8-oxo-dGTP pyrophosphatase MutT (NUDIX family)